MPFGELITAPLNACVNAQAQAATATAEYIKRVGFVYDAQEKVYKPVTVSFTYIAESRTKRFTLPLITVVPVPYLQIHDVNLVFATEVSVKDGGQMEAKVSTKNTESRGNESSEFRSDLKVNVNIKASTSDMPMGISRLLQVMQEHISVSEVKTDDEAEEKSTRTLGTVSTVASDANGGMMGSSK